MLTTVTLAALMLSIATIAARAEGEITPDDMMDGVVNDPAHNEADLMVGAMFGDLSGDMGICCGILEAKGVLNVNEDESAWTVNREQAEVTVEALATGTFCLLPDETPEHMQDATPDCGDPLCKGCTVARWIEWGREVAGNAQ